MLTTRTSVLLASLMLGACADAASEDELDGYDPIAMVGQCKPRQCGYTSYPAEFTQFDRAIAGLSPEIRDGYYARAITDLGTTPDQVSRYRFFEGSLGQGGAYTAVREFLEGGTTGSESTMLIYGAFLGAWAEGGYERGSLGYPRGNAHGDRQEFQPVQMAPTMENGGWERVRRFAVSHDPGLAVIIEQNEYLNSNAPDQPFSAPQECQYLDARFPQGSAGSVIYDGWFHPIWCGPLPTGIGDNGDFDYSDV